MKVNHLNCTDCAESKAQKPACTGKHDLLELELKVYLMGPLVRSTIRCFPFLQCIPTLLTGV
jgi:hypothetical protein